MSKLCVAEKVSEQEKVVKRPEGEAQRSFKLKGMLVVCDLRKPPSRSVCCKNKFAKFSNQWTEKDA